MTLKTIKIGDIVCEVGAKKTGFLKVLETPISTLQMPVMIINGSSLGPTLCLTGGVHGCEYPGPVAIMRVFKKIDPKDLSGALIAIPMVNMPSFQMKTPFLCPIDNVNINRIAPGSPSGSASYLIANTLFAEVVPKCDYLIDLHSGDVPEDLIPIAMAIKTGNEKVNKGSEMLARAYNFEYVLISKSGSGTISAEASKMGKPAITAEAGGMGVLDEKDIDLHIEGVMSIMRKIKMLKGIPKVRSNRKILSGMISIRAGRGGIFIRTVNPGDIVTKGQIVGEIVDLFGGTLEKVSPPVDGVVILVSVPPAVNTGDTLMVIGN